MNELVLSLALSAHLGMPGEYNNIHPNIGYQMDDYTVGVYHNSYYKPSYYASRKFSAPGGSVDVGAVTGYHINPAPMIRYNYQINRDLSVFAMPAYDVDSHRIGAVVGVEIQLSK